MVNSRREAHQHLSKENELLRGVVERQNASLAELPRLRHSIQQLSAMNAQYVHQEASLREEIARLSKMQRLDGSASDSGGSDSLARIDAPKAFTQTTFQVIYHLILSGAFTF